MAEMVEDFIDAGYERLMYTGEMVGKMSREGSDSSIRVIVKLDEKYVVVVK